MIKIWDIAFLRFRAPDLAQIGALVEDFGPAAASAGEPEGAAAQAADEVGRLGAFSDAVDDA